MKYNILIMMLLYCLAMPIYGFANENTPLKVTLLLEHKEPSTWNSLLLQGLQRAKNDFNIQDKIIVCENKAVQEKAFRDAAAQADLVLVATDEFHEILRDNAANFRNTYFGVIDAGIRGSNITCISFADEQAAFLAGAAAAMFIKNKTPSSAKNLAIGWLSGADIAAMRSMFNGFAEGAKLVAPEIKVIHGLAKSFVNHTQADLEAKRLIAEGVQVLVLAAGAGNKEVLQQAKAAGIYVIGLDVDQKDLYQGHVLLSIIKKVDDAVYSIIKDTVTHNFKAKEIEIYNLQHGLSITDPAKSLGQNSQLIQNIKRRLKELTHEIQNQGIHIKSLRARTLCNCL